MTRNWNSGSGAGSAVDTVVIAAIIEISDATVSDFMSSLSTLIVDDRVFYKPCLLFATGDVGLGERAEVRALGLGRSVSKLLEIRAWIGLTASRLAEPLLPEKADSVRSLMAIAIPVGAIHGYGMNRDCEQPLFEKINEVATLAIDNMYLEI